MNDTELDRALRAAINVDHSPEFLPRVRARVVVEPRQLWPRWTFALTGAGLAAVALVMAIVGWSGGQRREAPPPVVISKDTAPGVPPAPPSTIHGPAQSRPIVRRRPPVAPDFPAPVISPDDARAFALLVRSVRERRIPEELPMDSAANRAATLPSIEIPPVTIEPLPEIARLEGDRPR